MTPVGVLKTLDNTMAMKPGDWLVELLSKEENPVLIDLNSLSLKI